MTIHPTQAPRDWTHRNAERIGRRIPDRQHVHHLNVGIPFYRLPEVMAAIPRLQKPVTISLRLRDIVSCFRACLWDEERQQMVSYREARRHANADPADALQLSRWENEGGATRPGAQVLP